MISHLFGGHVADRGDYIVIKTPSNPGYFYGNLLLFFDAPKAGSLERWKHKFRDEFRGDPGITHFTFLWDTPDEIGDISDLKAANFQINSSKVLTASAVHPPPKLNAAVEMRVITTDDEWRAVTALQIRCGEEDYEPAAYSAFKHAQMSHYRAMSEAGRGAWFGHRHLVGIGQPDEEVGCRFGGCGTILLGGLHHVLDHGAREPLTGQRRHVPAVHFHHDAR